MVTQTVCLCVPVQHTVICRWTATVPRLSFFFVCCIRSHATNSPGLLPDYGSITEMAGFIVWSSLIGCQYATCQNMGNYESESTYLEMLREHVPGFVGLPAVAFRGWPTYRPLVGHRAWSSLVLC